MKRILLSLFFFLLLASDTYAGRLDSRGSTQTLTPALLKFPHSNTLPATCTTGQIYADDDATSGQRIYYCQSANTWALQGDGGGSGDVTGVGDCASGACGDGTSDGGTYYRFYDGDSNYTQLAPSNTAADIIVTLPATAGTLIHTETDPTALLTAGTDNVKDTHIDWGSGAGQVSGADITFAEGDMTDSTIVSADIKNGTIVAADTAITAGRSLTWSTDDLVADAELYTDTKCIWIENPVATDDLKSIWYAKNAATITSLWCESDQTVTAMVQVDDGTVADVDSVDLTCDSTPPEDTSLDGDATLAAGDRLDLDVASVASTPTWVSICWTYTLDD